MGDPNQPTTFIGMSAQLFVLAVRYALSKQNIDLDEIKKECGQVLDQALGWNIGKIKRFFEHIDTKLPGGWGGPVVDPDDLDWEQVFVYEPNYGPYEE